MLTKLTEERKKYCLKNLKKNLYTFVNNMRYFLLIFKNLQKNFQFF